MTEVPLSYIKSEAEKAARYYEHASKHPDASDLAWIYRALEVLATAALRARTEEGGR